MLPTYVYQTKEIKNQTTEQYLQLDFGISLIKIVNNTTYPFDQHK